MTHRPGGGYGSNKHIEKPQPKVEPKSRAANVATVGLLGSTVAFAKQPLERGKGYATPVGPTQSVAGPGGGRTVCQSGSQHGLKEAKPMSGGREALEGE
jgi:hypothetical protein